MSGTVRLADLDPDELGDHDVRGLMGGGLRGYECRRCGRFCRSPETFEAFDCR